MDENVIRLLCLIVGALAGNYFGGRYNVHTKSVRHLIQVSEETNSMLHTLLDVKPPVSGNPPSKQFGWRPPLRRDEKGVVELRFINLAALICLLIVIASLFSTLNTNKGLLEANAKIAATQDQQAQSQIVSDRENACTTNVLFGIVDAISPRSKYAVKQADAIIGLQKAQLLLLQTPTGASPKQGMIALQTYVRALTTYLRIVSDVRDAAVDNPYPKREQYEGCLRRAREKPVSDTSGGDL